jgi:hypothetical protein
MRVAMNNGNTYSNLIVVSGFHAHRIIDNIIVSIKPKIPCVLKKLFNNL